jgi:hypothetical protein
MASDWYRLGLLLVVFGGFLASNSTGSFAGFGISAMVVGLLVGIGGLVSPDSSNAE